MDVPHENTGDIQQNISTEINTTNIQYVDIQHFFNTLYFSLQEYVSPPLSGARVRKQWSALYYMDFMYLMDIIKHHKEHEKLNYILHMSLNHHILTSSMYIWTHIAIDD